MKIANVTYSQWKALLTARGLLPQYIEDPNGYDLFALESNLSWETRIIKDGGSDIVDFEANVKPTANKPLEIKAGPGRPPRTSASPQPINTMQHFKGYKLTLPILETSAYVDISFPSLVYVKGGHFYCSSILADDYLNVDVLYGANDMVIVPGLVTNCYLVPNTPVPFESAESMTLAPELKLRVTLNGTSSAVTARTVYIIAEYFV